MIVRIFLKIIFSNTINYILDFLNTYLFDILTSLAQCNLIHYVDTKIHVFTLFVRYRFIFIILTNRLSK